ncbi:MAG: hypothetical protein IKB82_01580 [Clostridia bacterium]|nr:hypothetical protein [Clostridia bacterium]
MALNNVRSLFPGAMGPDGFISCFDHLIEEPLLRRKIVLKGGPGVGKSTFMRRIHAALCADGTPSTLYFCSGDPDSLDAVAIPQAGLLILDGTAPHIIDPQIPGARDSIINLGEYLDETAICPRLAHIRVCMKDHAAASRRARACMQAACAMSRDNAAIAESALDARRMAQMTRALIHAALDTQAQPQEAPTARPVITDAVTPKGEICLIPENPQPRVIHIAAHWAMDVTPVLREVSHAARTAGFSVEEHICPTVPGRLLHLSIPALGVLLTTSELPASEQTFDFAACLPQSSLLRHETTLEQGRASIKLHLHRAVSHMAQAKQLHDELEAFYVPNMDFSRWQERLDSTLASLGKKDE